MIVGIHQPNYLPWIGYFYKIYMSDIFVILDDVQYVKRSVADRNKIKTPQGELYIKIPVESDTSNSKYNEVKVIDEMDWRNKHLKTIYRNYRKAKYFDDIFEDFCNLYKCDTNILSDFNSNIIEYVVKKIGIDTPIIYSSMLNINNKTSTDRLVEIIKKCGGNAYFSGSGGAKYQNEIEFEKNKINLIYTDFKPPIYDQLWGDFIPNLSIIDLLFNYGEESIKIIKNANKL